MSKIRTIHSVNHHLVWDNAIEPVMTVDPGTEVLLEVIDSSGGQITKQSSVDALRTLDFSRLNPVTGPIYVDGAEPGDVLTVEILEMGDNNWGWSAIIPNFGLLADDFPDPTLHISEHANGVVEFLPGIEIPSRPFPGTMGVAKKTPGQSSLMPPSCRGGNIDVRDMVVGSKLYLPVAVPGALFSAGDTHLAQGDGEVCGTAVESALNIKVRIGLEKGYRIPAPQFSVRQPLRGVEAEAGYFATTGVGPDLFAAAQDAVRAMIEHLGREYNLEPHHAYMLCSIAVDLKISEVVDQPNWVVSAYLPRGVFV